MTHTYADIRESDGFAFGFFVGSTFASAVCVGLKALTYAVWWLRSR